MSQLGLEMPDGLMPPFYAIVWRHHVESRWEDDDLHDHLSFCSYGEEAGEHHVTEIGDAKGVLWKREGIDWVAHERALSEDPYEGIERW